MLVKFAVCHLCPLKSESVQGRTISTSTDPKQMTCVDARYVLSVLSNCYRPYIDISLYPNSTANYIFNLDINFIKKI